MWRPNNWVEIKKTACRNRLSDLPDSIPKADCEHCPTEPLECSVDFEAGADAMFEALKKEGQYVDGSKAMFGVRYHSVEAYPRTFKGYILVIPSEYVDKPFPEDTQPDTGRRM
jgi:hypothetical protein